MQHETDHLRQLLSPPDPGNRNLKPSSLGRFISFDQCQRLFRLKLYGDDLQKQIFMASGTEQELIPPLLTNIGSEWERTIQDDLERAQWLVTVCGEDSSLEREIALTDLGEKRIVLQVRLGGEINGWTIGRSSPDLVVIDRTDPECLKLLIADLKSWRGVRLDHQLQVAMYALLAKATVPEARITQAVLYREPLGSGDGWTADERLHHAAAARLLGLGQGACLAVASPPEIYEEQIRRIVTDHGSLAENMASAPFDQLPFHLSSKCDGCNFNQFCLKTARESNDLSLIPFLAERDKRLLQSEQITTIEQLANLEQRDPAHFVTLMATSSLGPRVRELTQRAQAFIAWQTGERVDTVLAGSGYSSLPATRFDLHPNLIRIFLDFQTDTNHGHVYMLGALVSCLSDGNRENAREELIVRLADRPVETSEMEADLVAEWLRALLQSIRSLMTKSRDGYPSAPIHFHLWDGGQLGVLRNLVNRQHGAIIGIEQVLALMMQPAAFDSNNISSIASEIQHQRALPILCQSLQSVAAWFGFHWSDATRSQFRFRMFDALSMDQVADGAHLAPTRSRFRSDLPPEYAYLAWNAVDSFRALNGQPSSAQRVWSLYGSPSLESLSTFQGERLQAMRHIADRLRTNHQTTKSSFDLSVLARLSVRPERPIESIREFISVERHIELSEWRQVRSLALDRRIQMGETLVGRYLEENQTSETRALMIDAREKQARIDDLGEEFKHLNDDDRRSLRFNLGGAHVKLRIDPSDLPVPLEDALRLTRRRRGDFAVVAPAFSADLRRGADTMPFQTTARQILYATRSTISSLSSDGMVEIAVRSGGANHPGFAFGSRPLPFVPGELYTIDENPDSWPSYRQWKTALAVRGGHHHPAYDWIAGSAEQQSTWSRRESDAQRRFMDGINRYPEFDALAPAYEQSKQDFIGRYGDAPMILVQGPPGTGKSTTTGLAVWARLQGALASDRDYRIAITCKTHNATDVLLRAIWSARQQLETIAKLNPGFFAEHFDPRLFAIPVFRFEPKPDSPAYLRRFTATSNDACLNEARAFDRAIVGATTNAHGKLASRAWEDGNPVWDLLIADEASQMAVPEFLVASVGLRPDGRMIVVGDHRQMPPIVRQNVEPGDGPALDPYAMYRSIFDVVRHGGNDRVDIKFEQSFRIHRDVAEYLRREVYWEDGISLFSRRDNVLSGGEGESFSAAVLNAPSPLILIVHDEARSQTENPLEQELAISLLYALRERDDSTSAGVVVPHRAQRSDFRRRILSDTADERLADSVDTIERFQGNEREVIIYSATESDPAYLRDTGEFLFDPRRLTVAISRATHKLIVIASRSVFTYVPKDEATLRNTRIWRDLQTEACTIPIWSGSLRGHTIAVFGNPSLIQPGASLDPAIDA